MVDFLTSNFNFIIYGFELLAAIVGILCYKKFKNTATLYFIYFLVYLSICDFLGSYTYYIANNGFFSFLKGTLFVKNYWWFTLFWEVLAIVFFTYYYNRILENDKFKGVIKYSAFAFILFSVVYIGLNIGAYLNSSLPIISILGAIIIFLCAGFYFIEILLSDKVLEFYKSINFYISVAIFFWWLIITPIVFFEKYNSTSDWDFVFLKWQIILFANISMYLTFTFALIFCKPFNDTNNLN